MSDNLSKNRWSFEDEIALSQLDLRYAAKNNKRKIICTMDIPYPLLEQWHGIVYESNNKPNSSQTSQQDINSDQQSSTDPTLTANQGTSVNFVDLLEYCVPDRIFLISTDITVREKVNETLLKIAGGVAQLYKKSRGRARIDLDKRVRKFHLFEGEIKQIAEFHEGIKSIQDELKEWKEKCVHLEEEKEKNYE